MSTYKARKEDAVYMDKSPTMTDQAGANETDINVIVQRHSISHQAPGAMTEPTYGDFMYLPTTLKEALDVARSSKRLQEQLPPQLQGISLEELLALTPEQLTSKLTPVEQPKPPESKPA
ncbi:MAG: internal scaffolding protein [Microvirus sp.]|nr:MAG: internal scaffolding protein [Microvirus sp.]